MATLHSPAAPVRLPFRTVLLSMVLLWACYFIITTLRGYIAGFEMQGELFWRRGLVTLAGIAMTLVLWLVLRLFDGRSLWVRVAAATVIALPISIPIAQTNQWIFADIQKQEQERFTRERGLNIRRDEAGNLMVDLPGQKQQDLAGQQQPGGPQDDAGAASVVLVPAPTALDQWRQIIDIALNRYFLLLAWASLYFALLAVLEARNAERRAGEFREAARSAELRSLRYQVNPHFLFNALNSLSALVLTGKADRAENMIQTLATFYRHSLADDPTASVALKEEFALQEHYLAIEAIRFPDRLIVEIDLPPSLREAQVPGMILQPLVENSVKYAVAPLTRPVTIRISAREDFGRLAITVSDDGPGAQASKANHGFGIGLANVRDRLEAAFGQEATVTAGPCPEGHCTEIRLPLVRHG